MRARSWFLLSILGLAGLTPRTLAQTPQIPQPPDRLPLAAAVERAIGRFPAVEGARAREAEAREALGEAEASLRPRGRFNGSAIQYQEPMVVTPIHGFSPGLLPEFDETLFQGNLALSWILWDGGAGGARVRSAASQLQGAGAALTAAEQALAARVAAAYLTVLGQSQVLEAHDLRLRALEAELSRVRQRFDVGRAAKLEVLRAEAVLAGSQADRVRLTTAVDNAERELARLLDAPLEETRAARLVPVAAADPGPPDGPDRAALRQTLAAEGIAASPAVAQARSQLVTAEAGIALARSALKPELRAVANLNEWGAAQGDFATEWNAGFQVAVPLFDGGMTRRRIARAEAAHRAAAEQVRLAELQVREDVDRAAAREEEAQARMASLASAVERFAEVVRVQKLLLEEGAGTQTDYLAAEADLLAARASLAEAGHAAALARIDLARAAGRLSPDWLRANLETAP